MKIYVVDIRKWWNVTYAEARNILASGLPREQWTRANLQQYLMH